MVRVNKIPTKKTLFTFLLLAGVTLFVRPAQAQNTPHIIQLSGIVFSDSTGGIPGVHVYIPESGRGATTFNEGFFSLPVVPGDSVVFSFVGYKRRHYIVPETESKFITIRVELEEDVTYLQEVAVMPFPTEEVFKQAILALNIPLEDKTIDPNNINREVLLFMAQHTPMDGYQNQLYYLNQWSYYQANKNSPVINPFLNPFNWARFLQSLKKR